MGKNRDFSKFPNAITVLDNGNVGIGNSNPSTTLHISTTNGIRLQYPGNTGYTQFSTDGTNAYIFSGYDGERMRITSAGNVGIGTTSPTTILTLSKPIDSSAYGSGTRMLDFMSYFSGFDVSTVKASIYAGVSSVGTLRTDNGYMAFMTANAGVLSERIRIETNGNVGIGTTSPANLLSVVQSNSAASTTLDITNSSNASTTTKTAQLLFRISDTANDLKPAAAITAYPDGVNNISGGMYFSTRSGDGGPFERMRITSSGSVGIGTASPGANLHIYGSGTFVTQNIENASAWYALYRAKSANAPNYWQWGSWADGSYRLGRDGVADFLLMNSNGVTQLPYQPHFKYGIGGRTITSVTRFGTDFGFTVRTDRDAVDSSYFNKANGRFTAPVAGVYIFGCTIMRDANSGSGPVDFQVVKNEPNPISQSSSSTYGRGYAGSYTVSYEQLTIVVTVKMAANDYVCLDFSGNMSTYDDDSWFYGYLLG